LRTVTPLDGAAQNWFTVPEPQKAIAATQSATYLCKIAVPPGTAPATYALQAVVYSADTTPDETSTKSRRVTFAAAPSQPVDGGRKIPWWVFLIIGVVLVAVIGGVLALLLGDGDGEELTNVTPPEISGTPEVGQVLEASAGTWSLDLAELVPSFQWEQCASADAATCAPIEGARTAQYVPAAEDEGRTLRVVVGVRRMEEGETEETVAPDTSIPAAEPAATAASEVTAAVAAAPPQPQPVPPVVREPLSRATAQLSPPFQVVVLTAGDPVFDCDPPVDDQDPDPGTLLAPGSQVTLAVRPIGRFCFPIIFEQPILVPNDFGVPAFVEE